MWPTFDSDGNYCNDEFGVKELVASDSQCPLFLLSSFREAMNNAMEIEAVTETAIVNSTLSTTTVATTTLTTTNTTSQLQVVGFTVVNRCACNSRYEFTICLFLQLSPPMSSSPTTTQQPKPSKTPHATPVNSATLPTQTGRPTTATPLYESSPAQLPNHMKPFDSVRKTDIAPSSSYHAQHGCQICVCIRIV